jgi:hypothetical protein
MNKIRFYPILFALLLTACGGESGPQVVGELPTLAQLPTETHTPTQPPETWTLTPVPSLTPTETETSAPTSTATPTVTPSATITDTPSPTPTPTPTITPTNPPPADNEGILSLMLLALQATVLPPDVVQPVIGATAPIPGVTQLPPTTCMVQPTGGFGTIFASDPSLVTQIGCPVGTTASISSATQLYERGNMVWLAGPPPVIYTLFNTGRFNRYDDTYNANVDPFSGGEPAPNGLIEPVRGFGKVWRSNGDVRSNLGWATVDEAGATSTIQLFDRGQMVSLPQRNEIVIMIFDPGNVAGTWRVVSGNY